jgi:uncharacterized protein (TIGR02118 family)
MGIPSIRPPLTLTTFGAHLELARKIPTVRRLEAARVLNGPGGAQPPYYVVAEMWFDGMAALQFGLGSPEGHAVAAEVPEFATGGATRLMSEIT